LSTEEGILLSVVAPCRNEVLHIDRFLELALAQTGLPGNFEVIVAEGQSTDGTRQRLEQWCTRDTRVRLVENPERTTSSGLNRAIRAARGSIIARMDAHTEYAPDYLAECVRALSTSGADNVGGPALTRTTGYLQTANAAAYHSWFSVGGARFHDPGYEGVVDTVTYGCWRKATLLDLGLFDERFVRNQDDELNLRLVRRGGRIWQSPRIRSWYSPRASLAALWRQYFQYGYWKVQVIRKHRVPASPRHLVPFTALSLGVGLTLAGLWWPGAWYALGALAAVYLLLSVAASLHAAVRQRRLAVLPALPLIFMTYHISYAVGFAMGLVDALRRRSPRDSATLLSR
jgi:succinoglycan biosynthesis protein ExoA